MVLVMKYKKQIFLNEVNEIKDFVKHAEKCVDSVTVYSSEGYIVNGKSIMGLLSLDLSKPVEVEYNQSVDEQFDKYMSKF